MPKTIPPKVRERAEQMIIERVVANDPLPIIDAALEEMPDITRIGEENHRQLIQFARGAHAFRAWVMSGQKEWH